MEASNMSIYGLFWISYFLELSYLARYSLDLGTVYQTLEYRDV
jgi:hypothetical protein